MKRSVIISNKQVIYELPEEMPNNLRLRILGNWQRSGKSQNKLNKPNKLNNKNKFPVICFPHIFFDCSFFLFPVK